MVMNVKVAAAALGLSPAAVRKAIARGTLAATATLPEHGYRNRPVYEIEEAEVDRYRTTHLTPRLADRVAPPTESELRAMDGDR